MPAGMVSWGGQGLMTSHLAYLHRECYHTLIFDGRREYTHGSNVNGLLPEARTSIHLPLLKNILFTCTGLSKIEASSPSALPLRTIPNVRVG